MISLMMICYLFITSFSLLEFQNFAMALPELQRVMNCRSFGCLDDRFNCAFPCAFPVVKELEESFQTVAEWLLLAVALAM